jgi:hypothetical protein
MKPRAYTNEEVQEQIESHILALIRYWESVDLDHPKGTQDKTQSDTYSRLEGLAHSIMAALDGNSGALPGFAIIPIIHDGDVAFHKSEGENYYKGIRSHKYDVGGNLRYFVRKSKDNS